MRAMSAMSVMHVMHVMQVTPVTPDKPDKPVTPVTPYRSVIPAKAGIQANVDPFTDPYPHLSIDWRNP